MQWIKSQILFITYAGEPARDLFGNLRNMKVKKGISVPVQNIHIRVMVY